jgi:hypothetical protein
MSLAYEFEKSISGAGLVISPLHCYEMWCKTSTISWILVKRKYFLEVVFGGMKTIF